MNNLSTQLGQRNVPPGAMDVWNQGQMPTQLGMPSPQQAQPAASPVAMVQKLLRGRVALAIVLALIGAIIGAGAGYMSQAPKYEASGVLLISPLIPLVEGDKALPYYQQMMSTQVYTIVSPKVMNEVPKTEPWKSVIGKNNDALADLASNLKPTYTRNTLVINLDYITADQKVAQAGMQTVINVYSSQFRSNANNDVAKKLEEVKRRKQELDDKFNAAEAQILDVTRLYGTPELQGLMSAAQTKVEKIDGEKRNQESNWRNANDAIASRRDASGKLSIEELAAVDPILLKAINELRDLQNAAKLDENLLGAQHPKVRSEKIAIKLRQDAIEGLADADRTTIMAIIPDMVKGGGEKIMLTAGDMRLLEKRVDTLRAEYDEAVKERGKIASDAAKVDQQRATMKTLQSDIDSTNDRLTQMTYLAAATGKLEVVQDGSFATKTSDKKILFGLAGAIAGGVVPVGLLMLMGLMDTRFRYSDDAAGQSMAGIPLLGILPNLPDRLSDPAQASIAAHCVHQIRTMLQLNSMRDGSTAFAITSASSGDGKTSLSLALGLSFAASGSRTLLIDADLVGGGLSSRLGNDVQVGIVDALAGVGLEECVQPTDVSDLSLLPIGGAQAHHAGSFSPPAVRKLLSEIRKHYEVIIIDTGPVMGSIEATPICASVDGVVLTVARGQSRPLVERAITHLSSIGARVAGVVFNRAQHKDFEQSIGAISVRSAARSTMNGTGHNGRKNGDMGAVAAAVATSVRNEN